MQPNGQYIDTAWELHRNYRLTMSLKLLVNTQELLVNTQEALTAVGSAQLAHGWILAAPVSII